LPLFSSTVLRGGLLMLVTPGYSQKADARERFDSDTSIWTLFENAKSWVNRAYRLRV